MRKLTATLCLTLAVLLGSVGMSRSADFQKGLTAYQSGDYLTALREWKPVNIGLKPGQYVGVKRHQLRSDMTRAPIGALVISCGGC